MVTSNENNSMPRILHRRRRPFRTAASPLFAREEEEEDVGCSCAFLAVLCKDGGCIFYNPTQSKKEVELER